jgi:hypothetical protein
MEDINKNKNGNGRLGINFIWRGEITWTSGSNCFVWNVNTRQTNTDILDKLNFIIGNNKIISKKQFFYYIGDCIIRSHIKNGLAAYENKISFDEIIDDALITDKDATDVLSPDEKTRLIIDSLGNISEKGFKLRNELKRKTKHYKEILYRLDEVKKELNDGYRKYSTYYTQKDVDRLTSDSEKFGNEIEKIKKELEELQQ